MSSAVDDDTKETIAEGRAAAGAVLGNAKRHLQKIFIVVVAVLIGSIYILQVWGWDRLRADLIGQITGPAADQAKIIAITPFDVILLQFKIGIILGALAAVPLVLYFGRDGLKQRGLWPNRGFSRWKLAFVGVLGALLFLGGVSYGYFVFFPVVFDFLANNAVQAGFRPTYSIVKWAQFVFLLSLSFGLAAQLPLAMTALAYAEIVQYETFRDYWKHAIIVLYGAGALFTPPDPLTQIMWATPLVGLYAFSLKLTKVVVTAKRNAATVNVTGVARERWNLLAGSALVGFVVGYGVASPTGLTYVNRFFDALPYYDRTVNGGFLGLDPATAAVVIGVVLALVATVAMLLRSLSQALAQAERDRAAAVTAATDPLPASTGAPADIDIENLSATAIWAAPTEAFVEMGEDEMLQHAQAAMAEDDPDKAEAIMERWDVAHEGLPEDREAEAEEEDEGNVVTRTTAGVVGAFTEDEPDEDDIGGYYYDAAFILDSLTSKAFRIVGLFMGVLTLTFVWLYTGGIGQVKEDFLARLPTSVTPDQVGIVTLHPVEALVFEIKFSALLAGVVTLPLVLYYAWPAMTSRGWVGGNRNLLGAWSLTLLGGIGLGSYLGYTIVAPAVISYLAADALQAGMIISYRINNFGWLIVFTTVGIGLLAEVPVTMLLFHRGGLVSYDAMMRNWRAVVVAICAVAAIFTPKGTLTMLLFAIPVSLAYLLGLGILWVVTLGGRRVSRKSEGEAAD
jgi:sec-independent protein translocase protein TatC